MYKIKYAKKKNKKSSPFFAIVPSGKLLVMILTSPAPKRFSINSKETLATLKIFIPSIIISSSLKSFSSCYFIKFIFVFKGPQQKR